MPRILLALAFAASAAFAQDSPPANPEPSPAAEASPSPEATPAASPAAAAEATPEISPAPAASPAAEGASPSALAPEELPAPSSGEAAPLVTEDIIPMNEGAQTPDRAFVDPNAIIPDEPPAPPSPISAESETERRREETIRYRELRVKAEQEPEIAALRAKADAARSLEDQRAALREYYRRIFAHISKQDKSLANKCKGLEDAYLRRLAQYRLEPTIPLNLPPTPEPIN